MPVSKPLPASSVKPDEQPPNLTLVEMPELRRWALAFLNAKKADGLSPTTLRAYTHCVNPFVEWCALRNVDTVEGITPDVLREFMLSLEERGRGPGGRHIFYRVVKTFLLWWNTETEPENWRNPFLKVKAPKLDKDAPLQTVDMADVEKLLAAVNAGRWARRDRALLLTMLDTGVRVSELTALNVEDVDPYTGTVLVRQGKGGKSRSVFLGAKARRAVRAWLTVRPPPNTGPLFSNDDGNRFKREGIRQVLVRLSKRAGIQPPTPHSFRRAFALNFLRNGGDLLSLQRLMGHASLDLLYRYARQTQDDLQAAHGKNSPVDRANL